MGMRRTPGAWTYKPLAKGFAVYDERGTRIATVPRLADAKLMAASPVLAAALAKASEHLDWIGYGDGYERGCAKESGLEESVTSALSFIKEIENA